MATKCCIPCLLLMCAGLAWCKECPMLVRLWEAEARECMAPFDELPRNRKTTMAERCWAWRESRGCMADLIAVCRRDRPGLRFRQSLTFKTWDNRDREAVAYGRCY